MSVMVPFSDQSTMEITYLLYIMKMPLNCPSAIMTINLICVAMKSLKLLMWSELGIAIYFNCAMLKMSFELI
jgi:hypothetical protein